MKMAVHWVMFRLNLGIVSFSASLSKGLVAKEPPLKSFLEAIVSFAIEASPMV